MRQWSPFPKPKYLVIYFPLNQNHLGKLNQGFIFLLPYPYNPESMISAKILA